jgi:hypothetical protein
VLSSVEVDFVVLALFLLGTVAIQDLFKGRETMSLSEDDGDSELNTCFLTLFLFDVVTLRLVE